MNPLLSIEIDWHTALLLRDQLKNMAMPPLDDDDMARYTLYRAIVTAIEEDDA